ncbi:MAG: hypothetical protein KDD67_06710 [Ignavibacteriae bacterium]|nr:hypothetical protein [Ignavibacteriota bacterium]MCB9215628.1 hypothetical protein [Ignavibacteria bacterium]
MSRVIKLFWLFLLPLLLAIISVHTQAKERTASLVIDLRAQLPGTSVERPLYLSGRTKISLLLANISSAEIYHVSISLDNAELPAISVEPDHSLGGMFGELRVGEKGNSLQSASSGSAIQSESPEPSGGIGYQTPPLPHALPDEEQYQIADIVEMEPGQRLTVQVVGTLKGERGERKTWTTVFDGGTRGAWQISLGFGSPILLNRHRQFATVRDSGSERYKISERRSEDMFELIPAVFFHWTPTESKLRDWSWSMVGGLGLDFNEAVIFVGAAVTFNQNITLSLGGVAHQVRRLNPKYEADQYIPIELDDEQLHSEYYRINPFVGVTFRLASNIFGSGG